MALENSQHLLVVGIDNYISVYTVDYKNKPPKNQSTRPMKNQTEIRPMKKVQLTKKIGKSALINILKIFLVFFSWNTNKADNKNMLILCALCTLMNNDLKMTVGPLQMEVKKIQCYNIAMQFWTPVENNAFHHTLSLSPFVMYLHNIYEHHSIQVCYK